jgi:putative endonuclease
MKDHLYYVYILTNERHTVLYTGVTNNLSRRCKEHKDGLIPGFTKKYNIKKLIYYELFDQVEMAIAREKQIKLITRAKKETLVNGFNPEWKELFLNGKILRLSEL